MVSKCNVSRATDWPMLALISIRFFSKQTCWSITASAGAIFSGPGLIASGKRSRVGISNFCEQRASDG